jgi:hypothetical protein
MWPVLVLVGAIVVLACLLAISLCAASAQGNHVDVKREW